MEEENIEKNLEIWRFLDLRLSVFKSCLVFRFYLYTCKFDLRVEKRSM